MKVQKALYGCLIILVNAFVLYGLLQTTTTKLQDEARTIEAKQFIEETDTFRIFDYYGLPGHTDLQKFLDKQESVQKVTSMYRKLIEEPDIQYLEFSNILLQKEGYYEDKRQLVHGYEECPAEELDEFINQSIYYNNAEVLITNVKGSLIGKETCSLLRIQDKIAQGETLSEEDFCLEGDKIPVLLGYDYTENHSVGETFTVFYVGEPFVFEVKGILEKGTVITFGKKIESLDSQILVPSFEIPEERFQNAERSVRSTFLMHYLYKIEGYVIAESEKSVIALSRMINDAKAENGLELEYEPVGAENHTEKSLQQAVRSYQAINLFTVLEMIILGLALLCIFVIHFQRNQKDYAIHLICGATLGDIKKKVFFEFGGFMLCGYILCVVIFQWIEHTVYSGALIQQSTGILLILSGVVCVGVLLVANWYINHTSIYLHLRRK